MTAVLEESVLIPNRRKIQRLREEHGWSVDDAAAHARVAKIPLSRQTLFDLERESNAGARLKTMGYLLRLYGLRPVLDLPLVCEEVPEPDEVAPKRPKPKAANPRPSK